MALTEVIAYKDDDGEDQRQQDDCSILASQECFRTGLDRVRDLLHSRGAVIATGYVSGKQYGDNQRNNADGERKEEIGGGLGRDGDRLKPKRERGEQTVHVADSPELLSFVQVAITISQEPVYFK